MVLYLLFVSITFESLFHGCYEDGLSILLALKR